MSYRVRIYCHKSWETGACKHVPPHPFTVPTTIKSIRAANDHGGEVVAQLNDEEVEWEVINENGEVVC